jgi:hypothetical protein
MWLARKSDYVHKIIIQEILDSRCDIYFPIPCTPSTFTVLLDTKIFILAIMVTYGIGDS